MATINEVLDSIKGDAAGLIKQQLKDLLTQAETSATQIIKETGQKVSDWLVMRAAGKLNDEELQALLYSRDQTLRQAKNTLEIQARAKLETIAVGLVNLVLDKVLGVHV